MRRHRSPPRQLPEGVTLRAIEPPAHRDTYRRKGKDIKLHHYEVIRDGEVIGLVFQDSVTFESGHPQAPTCIRRWHSIHWRYNLNDRRYVDSWYGTRISAVMSLLNTLRLMAED